MRAIVKQGITYQLDSITENVRKVDLVHMIARDNHKSASSSGKYDILVRKL